MESPHDPIRIAREHIEAFSKGDEKRYRSTLTLDTVHREHGTGRELRGIDEVTASSFAWRQAFPDARGEITNAFASGDQVTLQIVWTATHKGDLVGPLGTVPATGKQAQLPSAYVVRISNGKIVSVDHYFNMLTLQQQLGPLPGK